MKKFLEFKNNLIIYILFIKRNVKMKKTIYFLTALFVIISKQLSATNHDMKYWEEVHEKAKQNNPEAAYELGEAWEQGNQGLNRSMYRSLLSYNCAYKKGNEEALEKIMRYEDLYRNWTCNAIGDIELTGASLICYGIYQYKGYARNNGKDLEKDNKKAKILFEEPISLESRRKQVNLKTTPAQKKWVARGYMWLGIMLYKEEISLKDLKESTWKKLDCREGSNSTQTAIAFFEKAVQLGSGSAKKYLNIAQEQWKMDFQQIMEDN